jgi:hypothetical protein
VDIPKSLSGLELVAVFAVASGGRDGVAGAIRATGVTGATGEVGATHAFFAAGVGSVGGAIGLFDLVWAAFCGLLRGVGMLPGSGSILRMFAVRLKGPGGTESGSFGALFGTAAFTVGSGGFVTGSALVLVPVLCTECGYACAFCCRAGGGCGSSSRSSREKSRSWVESGGIDSVTGSGGAIVFGITVCGVRSAESSRAICVPLSRKSSHPSKANVGGAVGWQRGGGFAACTFDAGSPGSLKVGFELICGFGLLDGGVGLFTRVGGRICP